MTVPVPSYTEKTWQGDGSTKAFSFQTRVLEASDLEVYLVDEDDNETLQSQSAYTLTGLGDSAGVTVTAGVAPTSAQRLRVRRVTVPKQTIDYTSLGKVPGDTTETQLDRLAMAGQDANGRLAALEAFELGVSDDVARAEDAADIAQAAAAAAEAAAGGNAYRFSTLAVAAAYTPDDGDEPPYTETAGYADPGDGGGSFFKLVSSEPTHPGKYQDGRGNWYEIVPRGRIDPRQFGAKCDNATDDSVAVSDADEVASAFGVALYVPPGNTIIDNVTLSSEIIFGDGRGVSALKQRDSTTNVICQLTGANVSVRDLTFVGNRVNQTDRHSAVTANVQTVVFNRVEFTGTVEHGIYIQNFAAAHFNDCEWNDMADHSGLANEPSMCVLADTLGTYAFLSFRNCRFYGATAASATSCGGILANTAGIELLVDGCLFSRIGQSSNGNFIGCVDHYRGADRAKVVNCTFIDCAYTPVKLSSCKTSIVTSNVCDGLNPSGVTAISMMFIGYRTSEADPVEAIVSGNIMKGSQAASNVFAQINGASGHVMSKVTVSGNQSRADGGITAHWIKDIHIDDNIIELTGAGRPFNIQNDVGNISIKNNDVRGGTTYALRVDAAEGCTGAVVTYEGNTHNDLAMAAASKIIIIDGVGAASFNGNTFDGTVNSVAVRIRNITRDCIIALNRGDANIVIDAPTGVTGSLVNANNTM